MVMSVYARPFDVDYKGPQDPVTEADRLGQYADLRAARARVSGRADRRRGERPGDVQRFSQIRPRVFRRPSRRHARVRRSQRRVRGDDRFDRRRARRSGGDRRASARRRIRRLGRTKARFRITGGQQSPIRVSDVAEVTAKRAWSARARIAARSYNAHWRCLNPREVLVMGSAGLKGTLVADRRSRSVRRARLRRKTLGRVRRRRVGHRRRRQAHRHPRQPDRLSRGVAQ